MSFSTRSHTHSTIEEDEQSLVNSTRLTGEEQYALFVEYWHCTTDAERRAIRARLLDAIYPMLYSLVKKLSHCFLYQDEQDVLQSACLLFLENVDAVPSGAHKPFAWLYKAISYRVIARSGIGGLIAFPRGSKDKFYSYLSLDYDMSKEGEGNTLYDCLPETTSCQDIEDAYQEERRQALEDAFHRLTLEQQQAVKDAYGVDFELYTDRPRRPSKQLLQTKKATDQMKHGSLKTFRQDAELAQRLGVSA